MIPCVLSSTRRKLLRLVISLGIWCFLDQCGRNFVLNGWCKPTGHSFRKTAMIGSQQPTLFVTAPPEGTLRLRAFGMTEISSETLVQCVNTILAIAPAVACSFFLRVGKAGLDSSEGDFLGFKELTCQSKGRVLTSVDLLRELQGPLLLFNLVSAVACLGQGPVDLTSPTMPFIIGFLTLSLLLAFRLTGAQSRASRAYDLWDDVLSICRTRASALSLLQFRDSLRRDHFMELARWIPAFPAALLCHVNSGLDLRTQLRQSRGPDHEAHEVPEIGGLTEAEIAEVMNRPAGISAPLFVVHRLAAISKKMDLSDTERMAMDAALSKLSNFVGSCEDVLPPSTPLGFATHTSRFLFLFLALLPLALQSQLGILTVFAEQIVAYIFLGIQSIAAALEDRPESLNLHSPKTEPYTLNSEIRQTGMEEPFELLPISQILSQIALESQVLRDEWDRKVMEDGLLSRQENEGLP
eukprot:s4020_g10.t1